MRGDGFFQVIKSERPKRPRCPCPSGKSRSSSKASEDTANIQRTTCECFSRLLTSHCFRLAGFSYYIISALGITAGAHRLWSHRSYKARLPLRVFLIIANTMAFQVGSRLCPALPSTLSVIRGGWRRSAPAEEQTPGQPCHFPLSWGSPQVQAQSLSP